MSARHTAGPWESSEVMVCGRPLERSGNYWQITAGVGFCAGGFEGDSPKAVDGCGFCVSGYMAEVDARLMAAAPDLLEALRDLVARCDGEGGILADGSNIDTLAAHFALAKAEATP